MHTRAGEVTKTREADDDLVIRVLGERFSARLTESVDVGAGGVECCEQRKRGGAHGVLDERLLPQMGHPQRGVKLGGEVVDAALAAAATRRPILVRSSPPRQRRRGAR